MSQFRLSILKYYRTCIAQAKRIGHDHIAVKVEDMELLLHGVDERNSCRKELFRKFIKDLSQHRDMRVSLMGVRSDELEIILVDVERSLCQ